MNWKNLCSNFLNSPCYYLSHMPLTFYYFNKQVHPFFFCFWKELENWMTASNADRSQLSPSQHHCHLLLGNQNFCLVPRLKATNERQDDGAGILHQVAQFPIDQVYLIYKAPMPLSAHARPRETRYWLQMKVGLYVPLNPPTPCSQRQLKRVGGE